MLRFLGAFSNLRVSGEHAEGVRLDLWRHAEGVIGVLSVAAGLAGDTPVGAIEGVRFDPRTGRLSFYAKLSTGTRYLGADSQPPTRDLYRFAGRLDRAAVIGDLLLEDHLETRRAPQRRRVALRRLASPGGDDPSGAASLATWREWSENLLRRRGPRW